MAPDAHAMLPATSVRRPEMRMGLRLAVGSAAALLLLCVVAPAAFTDPGQVAKQVTVAGPAGVLSCNTNLTVKATVVDAAGTPVDNQTVVWTFGAGKLARSEEHTSELQSRQ